MMMHAVYALACALVWSGTNIAGKMLPNTVPSMMFAFMRYMIACFCLLPFVTVGEYKKVSRSMMPYIMFLGFAVVILYNAFFFNALHLTSATAVALMSATNPMLTLFISSVLARKIPTKFQLLAFMLSFAGAALIITNGRIGLEVFSASLGELLSLGGVVTYVVYSLILRRISSDFNPLFLSCAVSLVGLAFLLPFVVNQEALTTVLSFSLRDWFLFVYLGAIGTATGMVLYTTALKRRGVEITSLITFSSMPFFVSILSYIFLGDRLSYPQMVGGLFVLAGLFVGVKKGHS